MRGRDEMNQDKRRSSASARTKRFTALTLAAMMVINVPTPVQAFSLKSAFKSISSAVNNVVKSVNKLTDSSSERTVYNYSELRDFLSSLFAPTDIKVKLGADITVPAGGSLSSCLHNVKMDMNGHTIRSNSSKNTFYASFGRKYEFKNGTFVQQANNPSGIISMDSGDVTLNNVTFKKSSNVTQAIGVSISGVFNEPKIELTGCNLNGMTTGIKMNGYARVYLTDSTIYNTQGDAVYMETYSYHQVSDGSIVTLTKNPVFTMTRGSIKYFKGNGIATAACANVTLDGVTVTGGTTRNRYGIRAVEDANVQLKNGTKVYDNVGGNIAVNKYCSNPDAEKKQIDVAKCPVTIDSVTAGRYSFTIIDKISSDETNAYTVAKVANKFSGEIESYNVYSDISRYMVLAETGNEAIKIQNPPTQCITDVEMEWQSGTKELDLDKDADYATVSVNGGEESKSGSATTKYAQKITLSTTNSNPKRFQFLGWQKYVNGKKDGKLITSSTCQIKAVDANATYKAVYQYKTYTLDVRTSGKGKVKLSGASEVSYNGTEHTYYVDDVVTLTAIPQDGTTDSKGNQITYGFKKWNDGFEVSDRTVTVKEDATYTAMFNKTGQTKGTMYVGLKEVTGTVPTDKSLLLVFVGSGYENNKMNVSGNLTMGITGLPDGSAKLEICSPETSDKPYNSGKDSYSFKEGKAPNYGYKYVNNLKDATLENTTCVKVLQAATDFDTCERGFIREETVNGKKIWLYWCCAGGVQAAGPYVLYSYDQAIEFEMDSVTMTMNPTFKPGTQEETISGSNIKVTAKDSNGIEYELGGLKFGGDDLDDKINYSEGDKLINFELDGVTVDYNFPEATMNGKEYKSLSDAISDATNGNETINIVGPGVDAIDKDMKVTLKDGVKIQGYDGDTIAAVGDSAVGADKDGMVRLFDGELEVTPKTDSETSVGVKDAFATTDKTIHVKTDENGNAYIVPNEKDTKLIISPDNNAKHTVEITGTKAENKYGFNNLEEYKDETVKIAGETEYSINLPKKDGETSAPTISTGKYNTGETIITPAADGNNRMPNISSSAEGDKVTVGGKTYTTGSMEKGEKTQYRVNPDSDAKPNVTLTEGSLGIPKGSTIQVGKTIIENTGTDKNDNSVQVNAKGEIDVPDGGGVTINGVQISVPAATPMNGNTKIILDENGKPHIKTTGGSDVTITIPGKNGEADKTYTYKAGDYDCELEIGEDGIPVLKNGDIQLKPGQIIKDSEGNEYQGSEGSDVTIMTSPKVYEKDENGNTLTDENGNANLIGGGDMGFDIPKDQSVKCKPNGENDYKKFENPGDSDGFFTLDPTKADEGIRADSELGLSAGKELNISLGNGESVKIKAPESAAAGSIKVDGSTGNITLAKKGDKVEIDGRIYEVTVDNTILNVNENGVSLVEGGIKANEDGVSTDRVKVTVPASSKGNVELIREASSESEGGASEIQNKIKVNGKDEFTISSISDPNESATLAPGKNGEHAYIVNDDGSITVSKNDSIVRKGSTSKTDVTIQAPDGADIKVKPLGKPSKEEIDQGYTTPASGLIVEVPNGNEVTIGNKKYKAGELNSGYSKDEEGEGTTPTLPLQLVLGDDGSVILHDGTAELEPNADIFVYDVNNKLTNITNKSEDPEKTIQVTNPGIITMPKSGTAVSMQENGTKETKFTSTKDDTQIVYSPDVCALKKGGVELSKDDKILIGETIIRNSSEGDQKVQVERTETVKKVKGTTEDGKEIETEELAYTGKITVPAGGCFEASYPGAKNKVDFSGNNKDQSTEFDINEDGNIVMPDGAIATINKGADKEVKIQTNSASGEEGAKVESTPTPDGMLFAIPKGGSITVNGKKYTNTAGEGDNNTLVLAVNNDGKVILVQGEVDLSEGSIVYVENEKEGLVPITNKNEPTTGDTPASGSSIKVSYKGIEQTYDKDDQITGTKYPEVKIEMSKDTTVAVGTNVYENTTSGTDSSETTAKINLDLTKDDEESVGKNNISGSKVALETGSVNMDKGSSISVGTGNDKKVISNIGAPNLEPGAADTSNSIQVSSDAKLKLPTNSGAISKDTSGNETKIQVPENTASEDKDYRAEVDLEKKSGETDKVEIKLTPSGSDETGSITSGSDKTIFINDGTYISKEDGKNLTLELNPVDKEVSMAGSTNNVGLANNASVTVGDTTVKAGTEDDKVIDVVAEDKTDETGASVKVPQIDIPGGGQANITNPKKKQDMTVSVPEKKDGESQDENKQQISVDPNTGNLSTNLKKDETIVIGGIEYTGTAENPDEDNNIEVDGKTGSLVSGSDEAGGSTPKVDAKIDATKFNNPNYRYTIPKGSSVSVNGIEYVAPDDCDIILSGNPNGNPVIEIENEGGTITIGGKTYTAGNAKSKFTVDNSGNITLEDNGNAAANSSVKLGGSDAQKVNGVNYRGSSQDDSYTITYKEGGCVVEPADGTKLSVDIPAGSMIYLDGKGAVDTVDDKGKKVTEFFDGPLPIKATGGSGSIYLDKTVEDSADTTYVSVSGQSDMKLSYTGSGDSKLLSSIEIVSKKQQTSQSDDKEETGNSSNNITIKDKDTGKDIQIPVEVKDDKVVIRDIPKKTLDQVISTDEKGEKSLVLDCSALDKDKVELNVATVENIVAQAERIEIITKGADIILDKKAANAIIEQAAGNTIEIKVSNEDIKEQLNEKQYQSVEKYDVRACLDAYVESDGVRIHDFKTGVIRVGIPWKVEKKKKAVYYHIYYVDDQGKTKYYDTSYEDGKLWFETNHFSEYVIVYDDEQLNGTPVDQSPVLAKCVKATKNSIRLEWKKVDNAKSYEVYVALCNSNGKKNTLKKVATLKADKTKYAVTGLKSGKNYKIVVKAMQGGKCIKKSCTLHVATVGGKASNASALRTTKKKIQLKKGETTTIKTSFKETSKSIAHAQAVRYVSGNKEVATVDKKGKVTAKHAGTCKIYALLNSGEYVTIRVTVK